MAVISKSFLNYHPIPAKIKKLAKDFLHKQHCNNNIANKKFSRNTNLKN